MHSGSGGVRAACGVRQLGVAARLPLACLAALLVAPALRRAPLALQLAAHPPRCLLRRGGRRARPLLLGGLPLARRRGVCLALPLLRRVSLRNLRSRQ
jgi:hypothetical protein